MVTFGRAGTLYEAGVQRPRSLWAEVASLTVERILLSTPMRTCNLPRLPGKMWHDPWGSWYRTSYTKEVLVVVPMSVTKNLRHHDRC